MRKFYIEDQKGERIPLNNETGIFLYEPDGLGIEYSHDYGESGSGFFMRIKDGVSQKETTFTLVFEPGEMLVQYDGSRALAGEAIVGIAIVGDVPNITIESPYERYKKFLDWIYSAEELYFVYCPYGSNEYYKRIEIRSIEKSELDKYASLQCATTIVPLTPWYLPAPIHINFGGDQEDNAMRFDYYYTDDLIYGVGMRDYTAEITAKGHIPSAMKITFKGQVTNPEFTLRGMSTRKEYGVCAITGSFVQTDTIEFSTAEQDSYIKKIAADGTETDLIDSIDITKNPFFRVPLSEPCEVVLSGESILGEASMLLYVYYRGV